MALHPPDDEWGIDEAAPVIARAVNDVAAWTVTGGGAPLAIEQRDLLTDLGEVTMSDAEPVRLADLPPRLRDLAKTWGPYKSLTGTALRELLTAEGVRTTSTGNVPRVDLDSLRAVLGRRDEEE